MLEGLVQRNRPRDMIQRLSSVINCQSPFSSNELKFSQFSKCLHFKVSLKWGVLGLAGPEKGEVKPYSSIAAVQCSYAVCFPFASIPPSHPFTSFHQVHLKTLDETPMRCSGHTWDGSSSQEMSLKHTKIRSDKKESVGCCCFGNYQTCRVLVGDGSLSSHHLMDLGTILMVKRCCWWSSTWMRFE